MWVCVVVGPVHVQVSTYVQDVSVYALGVCQYIFVVIYMHVHVCALVYLEEIG